MRRRRRSRASTYETSRKIAIFHPPSQPVALPQAVRLLGAWPEGTVTRKYPGRANSRGPGLQSFATLLLHPARRLCAYALLRKERPLASKTKYGLDTAFELLNPVLLTQATRYDPQGSFDPCGAKLIKKQGLPSPRTRIERLRARGLGPCEHSFVASVARPTAVSAERSRTAFGSEAPLGAARASLAPERTSPLRRRSPSSRPEASWRRSRRR
jgi:hypothetical protein